MVAGGLKAPVETDMRNDIWIKLIGNAIFNPLSALTRATMARCAANPPPARWRAPAWRRPRDRPRARLRARRSRSSGGIDGAERVGEHKTSTLKDLEAGKRLELDARSSPSSSSPSSPARRHRRCARSRPAARCSPRASGWRNRSAPGGRQEHADGPPDLSEVDIGRDRGLVGRLRRELLEAVESAQQRRVEHAAEKVAGDVVGALRREPVAVAQECGQPTLRRGEDRVEVEGRGLGTPLGLGDEERQVRSAGR